MHDSKTGTINDPSPDEWDEATAQAYANARIRDALRFLNCVLDEMHTAHITDAATFNDAWDHLLDAKASMEKLISS